MSDNRRYQVFVSSTFEDLKEERQAVYETLLKNDCIPAGMEFFGAVDEQQFDFIKKIIDDSDYYLVIIGNRYGSLTEEGISYTEKEYYYAKEKGLPISALIHGTPENISYEKSEKDQNLYKRLQQFKKELGNGRLNEKWFNPDDLAKNAQTSLQRHIKQFPRPGWIRGNKQTAPVELKYTKTILQKDVSFPDVLIKYEEVFTEQKDEIQINLGTVLLTTGAKLAMSTPSHIYRQAIEAIVKKSKNIPLNTAINIQDADYNRIVSLLYAKKIIDINTDDNWPNSGCEFLKISSHGREVLSEIV